jgi:hypothetical protein
MMIIVRSSGAPPQALGIVVKLTRPSPSNVPDAADKTDFFCVGDAEALAALRGGTWQVVELRDGYYEDGKGGGIAIWGEGRYWEIRSEPLAVTEAVVASNAAPPGAPDAEHVEVRRAVFGA